MQTWTLLASAGLLGVVSPSYARAANEVETTADVGEGSTEDFTFGSYGRITAGSDLRGGRGRGNQVIAHAPRLLAGPYVELDLGHLHELDGGAAFLTQITVAFGERLFHFDGEFEADIAARNLYVETRGLLADGLALWVGSRMYRGDDIYLLDFWPLDEQNTVGGGIAYRFGDTELRLHAGVNRLADSYQTQTIVVPEDELGSREVLFLDRQRTVVSARGEHHFDLEGALQLKAVLYGEAHALPAGTLRTEDYRNESLPRDEGWLVGAEASAYGFGREANHVNLFVRLATGLAAYDELGVPFGLDRDKRAAGAREVLVGVSSNLEVDRFGLLFGGYTRYFVDADPNVYDRDDVWEIGAAVRPAWFLGEHLSLLGEANVQYQRPNGLSPVSGRHEQPLVVQLGIMPAVSLGRGSYARPQLVLMYVASLLNDAALALYANDDPRRQRSVEHFLGVGVEWWFNSTRYQGGA